jgi:two-component system OmpR family sensor kinase
VKIRALGGLRGRLAIGTLLVLVVAILVADLAAFVGLRQLANQRISDNLSLAANRALALTRTLKTVDKTTLDRMSPSNIYFGFYSPEGELLLEHLPTDHGQMPLPGVPAPQYLTAEPELVSVDGSSEGLEVIGRNLPIEQQIPAVIDGKPVTIGGLSVGISNYSNVQAVSQFVRLQAVTALALLALAIASVFVVLRLGLRPLRAVAATAKEISQGDLTRRIPVSDGATEIGAVSAALNEAFDHAEASDARMRAFIADASHELRTPLAAIHGWADLYLHDGVREWDEVDLAMTRILDESARMTDLVSQLLTLARIDSDALVGTDDVNLAALVTDVIGAVSVTAPEHFIRFTPEEITGPHVVGDAATLRQLITNLVANATQHTPAGTTIEISLGIDDEGGPHAVLIVNDDGPGMSQGDIAHAFDRFWRADTGRGRAGGTGLGLSIVRATALAHHGTADITSAMGHGLTVTVRLPLTAPAATGIDAA